MVSKVGADSFTVATRQKPLPPRNSTDINTFQGRLALLLAEASAAVRLSPADARRLWLKIKRG